MLKAGSVFEKKVNLIPPPTPDGIRCYPHDGKIRGKASSFRSMPIGSKFRVFRLEVGYRGTLREGDVLEITNPALAKNGRSRSSYHLGAITNAILELITEDF